MVGDSPGRSFNRLNVRRQDHRVLYRSFMVLAIRFHVSDCDGPGSAIQLRIFIRGVIFSFHLGHPIAHLWQDIASSRGAF